ncbi:hypothetical protein XFF6990_140227 [Xanthomonas citri pv. fuscans]|uniref:Uncharacterized protein n=1 Tax=Xanthomonas campestris pv. phaseoli TaxID=317013 RepID=A0A7Z7IXG8_XANCH|nr:hypothetical protein XFF6990_140227 [Xanthomonas citri pv. fuscans]SOO22157.1 hypothetical protein XFF6991_120024 [Xanthomonas phaseoli pv. phaseoli]
MRRSMKIELDLIYFRRIHVLRRSVTIDCKESRVQCAAATGSRTDAQGFACRRPFLRSPSRASWRSTPVFLACNTASVCSRAT